MENHSVGVSGQCYWEAGIQDEGKHYPQISSCRIDFRGIPFQSVPIRTISSREMPSPFHGQNSNTDLYG